MSGALQTKNTWSTADTVRLTGATLKQVQHWVRQGAIEPAQRANGTGSRMRFGRRNLTEIAVGVRIAAVLNQTLHAVAVDRMARRLAQTWPEVPEVLWICEVGHVHDAPPQAHRACVMVRVGAIAWALEARL